MVLESRGFWLFFETNSDSKTLDGQVGVVGFFVSLMAERDQLSVCFSNNLSLGSVATPYYRLITDALLASLELNALEPSMSLYEVKVRISDLIANCIENGQGVVQPLVQRVMPRNIFRIQANSDRSWSIVLSTPGMSEVFLLPPPIEVLESNQLQDKLKEAEEFAYLGQFHAAKKSLYEKLDDDISSLYVMRREAMINLMMSEDYSLEQSRQLLKQDTSNLLFLSIHYRATKSSQDAVGQLKVLSKIGTILSEMIESFDQLRVIDQVLAELLGDAWRLEKPARAFDCYRRILQRSTKNQRVILKILPICQQLALVQEQINYSKQLLETENDRSKRCSLLKRLAELVKVDDITSAAGYATKALQLNLGDYDYLGEVVELWLEASSAENAISVLDQYLAASSSRITKERQIEVELKVAQIWLEALGREDMAIDRLKRACAVSTIELDSLQATLSLATVLNEKNIQLKTYDKIFSVSVKQESLESLMVSLNFLTKHYRSLNDQANLERIHLKLVDDFIKSVDDIDKLISHHELDIDWRFLFSKLELKLSNEPREKLQELYLGMGRVAQSNLFDRELAAKFYEKALEHGSAEAYVYTYLDDFYARKHDTANRTRILRIQLDQAAPQDSSEILKQLFYAAESSDAQTADDYALRLQRFNSESEPLKRRLMYYQSNSDLANFTSLISQLLDQIVENESKIFWLDLALEVLNDFDTDGRYEYIQKYLRMLEVLHEDSSYVYELGVKYHQNNPDFKSLAYYLDKLISDGVMPKLDPQIILRSLSDQKASKGYYLLHLAKSEDNEEARFQLYHRALGILRGFNTSTKAIVDIYQELSDNYILKVSDLRDFSKTCSDLDLLSIFTRSLLNQVNKMPKATFDLDIFNFILDFLKTHPVDSELLIPVIIKRIEQLKLGLRVRLMFELFLSISNKDDFFTEDYALEYLSEAEHWDFLLVLSSYLHGYMKRMVR